MMFTDRKPQAEAFEQQDGMDQVKQRHGGSWAG